MLGGAATPVAQGARAGTFAPPARATGSPAWRELDAAEAATWTPRLLDAGASLFQLPYWNEPLAYLRLRARHLVCSYGARDVAYACLLTLGPPGLRIALLQRGPVALDGARIDPEALESLSRWARRHGCVFLRVTHHDPSVIEAARSLPRARDLDAFPFYREPESELVVDQVGSDAELNARFQPIARREIAHAERHGYTLFRGERPEDLAAVWPLFERLGRRKSFSFRPLASFMRLLELAGPHDGAAVYVARLGDRPVQALLIVRSRDTAHYVSGALDLEALGDAPSPSAWLHWRVMRQLAAAGATRYDLGTRSGTVHAFKRKFRPVETVHPLPVTLVLNRPLFAAWQVASAVATGERRRRLKRLLSRVLGRGAPGESR